MRYRRADVRGGTYFFTVNLAERQNTLLIDEIDKLKASLLAMKKRHPFVLDAMVVLPNHMHILMTLPEGDNDFPTRLRLLKSGFSRLIPKTELIRETRKKKGERGIWQRRYWEHLIRDDRDYANHVEYIHNNPVKHGYVNKAQDWQYSTIHKKIMYQPTSSIF